MLGFWCKVRIGYSMHPICLILWFQERTHQAASSGAVPNDHGTERCSFCSAFACADETTLGNTLTNVCRLWQRDLSFVSSFWVIAPQATAASPEWLVKVWMHHRNICWECWMYALVEAIWSSFQDWLTFWWRRLFQKWHTCCFPYNVQVLAFRWHKHEKLWVLSRRRVWGSNALPQTTSPWSWQTAQGEA